MRGRFITLEGTEGAGKSTNMDTVCSTLGAHGIDYHRTREPGGTPMAEALREILLDEWSERVDGLSELLVVFAARNQHVDQVIRPKLEAGIWVVCDRFTDATYAYQGYGRGLALDRIATLEGWVHGDLQPDMTIYLDVPNELSVARIAGRPKDRLEQEDERFFSDVRRGYIERAGQDPRFSIVDATRALEDVQHDVRSIVEDLVAARLSERGS
jgi:dTMP kinase